MGGFRDLIAVMACPHKRHSEPDEYGDALCFVCEQKIPVRLTEAGLMRAFEQWFEEPGRHGRGPQA